MDKPMSDQPPPQEQQAQQEQQDQFSVKKIQALLAVKDDTSRFVGLALLKTLLDNSEELRKDENTIQAVWQTISPNFLDRLIKTGSGPRSEGRDQDAGKNRDMLDLAASVLHTFVTLLPEDALKAKRVVGRIPHLVSCLLHSSEETTKLVLETLLSLVSQPEGAREFNQVDDLTPLTEIAPSHHLSLKILQYAWLGGMAAVASPDKTTLGVKIDTTIGNLMSSFKGTDAVTLLDFLSELLRGLDPAILPPNPKWLPPLRVFIQNLVKSRPTAAGRAAWTNISATLLEIYPLQAPSILFLYHADNDKDKKRKKPAKTTAEPEAPFSYVIISLLLVDLRASLPSLLEKLNSPDYSPISTRLSSAFTILSNFTAYLLRAVDSDNDQIFTQIITPELLLKLRKSISETMSLTVEYLRDRWDASIAGAMGLHPDSRPNTVHASTGSSNLPLAWDSKDDTITEDPLIESAIQALAIWLREDDGELLRQEATGLTDMFIDLYRTSMAVFIHPLQNPTGKNNVRKTQIDFRRPILAALEGIITDHTGVESFLYHQGWQVLSSDLVSILHLSSSSSASSSSSSSSSPSSSPLMDRVKEKETSRGLEIIRILLPIAEAESPGPREEWMDLVTRVSGIYIPPPPPPPLPSSPQPSLSAGTSSQPAGSGLGEGEDTSTLLEFQIAALQLVTSLLADSHPRIQKRYVHSMAALVGIARQLREGLLMMTTRAQEKEEDKGLLESVDDVLATIEEVQRRF